MSAARLARCITAECANFGSAKNGGRCNSCAAGNAAAPAAAEDVEVEAPPPPAIAALIGATRAAREAALGDISAYAPMHQVLPWLWIGDERAAGVLPPFELRAGATPAAALAALRAAGVAAVVCASGDGASHRPFEGEGIFYAQALLSDGSLASKRACEAALGRLLRAAVPLARAARAAGRAVLVHCNAGINRSCSTACALLMVETGCSLAEAYAQVVAARVVCQPSFYAYLGGDAFRALAAELAPATAADDAAASPLPAGGASA